MGPIRDNLTFAASTYLLSAALVVVLSTPACFAKGHSHSSKNQSRSHHHSQPTNSKVYKALLKTAQAQRSVMLPHVKQKTMWISKSPKGGIGTSVVTGFHDIKGWEKSVVKKDPNLPHWQWLGMQEADKAYLHVAPGSLPQKGGGPLRKSHYVKPVHVTTMAPHHQPIPAVNRDVSAHYIKPVQVPLPKPTFDTSARLNAPQTHISLSAPKTNAHLTSQNTHISLSAPQTHASLAVPQTHVSLSAPSTDARLASQSTNAQLKQSKPVPADEMSAASQKPVDADTFQDPSQESYSTYGPTHRSVMTGRGSSAVNVRGRLLKRGRGY